MKELKSSKKLFSEFPPVSKSQWKEQVIADLKGADFDKKLVWRTYEGFDLQPYYSKDDLSSLEYLKQFENMSLNTQDAAQGPRHWVNRERIVVNDVKKANKDAINALNQGSDGIIFDLSGKESIDLRELLNNILPLHCSVSFIADRNAAKLLKGYFTYESESHIETKQLFGSLNYDPLSNLLKTGKMADDGIKVLKEIIDLTDTASRFYGLTINSSSFQNAGANTIQELAFTLNMAVEYINKLVEAGLSAEKVIDNIEFSMAVGTNYFMEIAKLKVLRILFYKIAEAYGVSDYHPGKVSIHSISSLWTKTVYDPYVNMLRNTTEAMSAIIGGCDSLTIAPYNQHFEVPSEFSRRISRNVSTMLKEESYFDKIVDPAAGSYYILNITDNLLQKTWSLFNEIESEGGLISAFEKGIIQEKIKSVRDDKMKKAAQRREVFVGINQYPNTGEQIDPEKISGASVHVEGNVLPQLNGGAEFEAMRLATEKYAKKAGRPKAYMALVGTNAGMRTARSMFSGGYLGCAGFQIVDGKIAASTEEAVEQAIKANAEIVVICGADDEYATAGVEFAKGYRSRNKEGIVVLAGYPTEIVEDLKNAGVDEFIHVRAELIDTLTRFQKKLNII